MKQVISRTVYDTEKAESIATHNPVKDRRDFRYLKEVLYKTDSGNYFLHGEGGPKTEYAKTNGGTTSGSEEIKPLSEDEALDWCENHTVDADVIIDEFGDKLEEA
jgi:hypothetical protein